jgi:hypothetical protein
VDGGKRGRGGRGEVLRRYPGFRRSAGCSSGDRRQRWSRPKERLYCPTGWQSLCTRCEPPPEGLHTPGEKSHHHTIKYPIGKRGPSPEESASLAGTRLYSSQTGRRAIAPSLIGIYADRGFSNRVVECTSCNPYPVALCSPPPPPPPPP